MENAPTTAATHTPSPLPLLIFPAPPLSAAEIAILTAPPPPFPGRSSSVDLSPIEFLLVIAALVTVPAIIYTLFFGCPYRRRQSEQISGEPSRELRDGDASTAVSLTDLRYRKDAHVKEIGGECPVCLSAFADGEKLRRLSACEHCFHADCIDLWLSNHSNCPICRAEVAGAGGKRQRSPAPARDHDLQQGLPDASGLV